MGNPSEVQPGLVTDLLYWCVWLGVVAGSVLVSSLPHWLQTRRAVPVVELVGARIVSQPPQVCPSAQGFGDSSWVFTEVWVKEEAESSREDSS